MSINDLNNHLVDIVYSFCYQFRESLPISSPRKKEVQKEEKETVYFHWLPLWCFLFLSSYICIVREVDCEGLSYREASEDDDDKGR